MSSLVINSNRTSYKSVKSGSSSVLVDERAVGLLAQRGSITCDVAPGPHSVRIKRLWVSSPKVELSVAANEVVHLQANVDGTHNFARFWSAVFAPNRALTLIVSKDGGPSDANSVDTSRLQNANALLSVPLLAGLIIFLTGIGDDSGWVVGLGSAVVVVTLFTVGLIRRTISKNVRRTMVRE